MKNQPVSRQAVVSIELLEIIMAQKSKVTFEVRVDETLYRKLLGVAEREKCNLNNHMLKLIRTNVEYSERIHGKIDISKYPIPEQTEEE